MSTGSLRIRWSWKVWITAWLRTSQSLTDLSSPEESTRRSSGENFAQRTQFEWPERENLKRCPGIDEAESAELLLEVPDHHAAVRTAGDHLPPIRVEGEGVHRVLVAAEGALQAGVERHRYRAHEFAATRKCGER